METFLNQIIEDLVTEGFIPLNIPVKNYRHLFIFKNLKRDLFFTPGEDRPTIKMTETIISMKQKVN
jgi:hypothetical protein